MEYQWYSILSLVSNYVTTISRDVFLSFSIGLGMIKSEYELKKYLASLCRTLTYRLDRLPTWPFCQINNNSANPNTKVCLNFCEVNGNCM